MTVMSTVSELMWMASASGSGVPSSALSARSTEVDTQVNVGVSRLVYADASVVRRRWTRSRKRDGSSASNATTNSWSSRPNEYDVLRSMSGYSRPTRMCSCMIRQRSSAGLAYHSRVLTNG